MLGPRNDATAGCEAAAARLRLAMRLAESALALGGTAARAAREDVVASEGERTCCQVAWSVMGALAIVSKNWTPMGSCEEGLSDTCSM